MHVCPATRCTCTRRLDVRVPSLRHAQTNGLRVFSTFAAVARLAAHSVCKTEALRSTWRFESSPRHTAKVQSPEFRVQSSEFRVQESSGVHSSEFKSSEFSL